MKVCPRSLSVLSKVDDILKLLENGKWHDLKEIGEKTQLHDLDVKNVAKFLAQYNFIKLDKEGKKAKLDSSAQDFLKKIRQLEVEEKR
jgi:DNA-binding IclR family transcriptional regulator